MRLGRAVALGGASLLLAGCGTADHDAAVAAVRAFAAARGEHGRVHCTSGVGTPYRLRTPDFMCIVALGGTRCDELHARRTGHVWHVSLYRRDVDCVLPA